MRALWQTRGRRFSDTWALNRSSSQRGKPIPLFVVTSLSELKVRLEDANIDEYESSLANKREKVQRYVREEM